MGKGYPAPKAETRIHVTGMAVIHATTAEAFNKISQKLIKDGFKCVEHMQVHSVEGQGFQFTQTLIKSKDGSEPPVILTKDVTEQLLIHEHDAETFNDKVKKAFSDDYLLRDPNGVNIRYDGLKKSMCFTTFFIKGSASSLILPYGDTGKKVLVN